jgi:hypothetical protein
VAGDDHPPEFENTPPGIFAGEIASGSFGGHRRLKIKSARQPGFDLPLTRLNIILPANLFMP